MFLLKLSLILQRCPKVTFEQTDEQTQTNRHTQNKCDFLRFSTMRNTLSVNNDMTGKRNLQNTGIITYL